MFGQMCVGGGWPGVDAAASAWKRHLHKAARGCRGARDTEETTAMAMHRQPVTTRGFGYCARRIAKLPDNMSADWQPLRPGTGKGRVKKKKKRKFRRRLLPDRRGVHAHLLGGAALHSQASP